MRRMKDSGVAWIGEIPEEWDLKQLRRFAQICNGADAKEVTNDNGQYPVIGSGGIFGKSSEFLYDKPSVLLGRKGTINKPIYIDSPFWVVDTMFFTKINKTVFGKFFYYLCLSIPFGLYEYGSAVPSMTQRDLNEIIFPAPPLPEQHLIADYLDAKCAEIDRSMELVRQGIDKLKEYKKSVITEAVTKGLDPDVPMKDSGVPWIGEIPEGWRKIRLRYLCDISTGNKDTVDQNPDGIYPFFVRSPIIEKIDSYSFDGEAILMAGDGVGAGKVFHYFTGKFDYHQRVYNLHNFVNYISGKYLFYYLKVNFIRKIEEATAKSTVDSVRLPMLLDFPIVLGNIQEQLFIVHYLDAKCAEIDTLIAQKQALLDKLAEYKKSLIFECVTGKREVAA